MKIIKNIWDEISTYKWTGIQPSIPYDTAWAASVRDNQNNPLFPDAVSWVKDHQNTDGSWGFQKPYFFVCEQLTATLASLRALVLVDKNKFAKEIDKGVNYLNENISKIDSHLQKDNVKTVGFEFIFPSLLKNLESTLDFSFNTSKYNSLMEHKLRKLPLSIITRTKTPLLYSIEFMDKLDPNLDLNFDYLLSKDGSISSSPSASAFYLSHKPKTSDFIYNYMKNSQNYDGGFPAYTSGGLFSIAYSLYIMQKTYGHIPKDLMYLLRYLDLNWTPMGIGIGESFVIQDLDDTALSLKLLSDGHFLTPRKEKMYWNVLDSYFKDQGGYFITFPFEDDPSYLVNLHVLEALKSNKNKKALYFDSLVRFLEKEFRKNSSFSEDKYYYSPYLQNSRALMIFSDVNSELSTRLLNWFINAQRDDGLWGGSPNVEELSQVIQALSYYNYNVERIDLSILEPAVSFIEKNIREKDSQFLWIAKSFFAPTEVVNANLISALAMYDHCVNKQRSSFLGKVIPNNVYGLIR